MKEGQTQEPVGGMKWIDVNKRLPDEGGRYWCYVEDINDLGISHFQWNCCYHEDTKTFSDRYLTDGEQVTHWMPLMPAPDASLPSTPVTGESEAIGERKFTLKEALEIHTAGVIEGNRQAYGKPCIDQKKYFKDKFGIEI